MLISIIIPAYNVEDYIEECARSAFGQTYKPIEVICIDNNSTDNTWQRLLKLQTVFPDLIIEKELKPGAPAARNKGLALSKGKWIQFLDADDLLLPNKIEHQVALIKPQISFISGAFTKVYTSGKKLQVIADNNDPIKDLFQSKLGITSSILWHKETLLKVGGWDEELISSQEAALMFILLKTKYEVLYDPLPLTIIRYREAGQISTNAPKKNWDNYVQLRINILDWLKEEKRNYYINNRKWFDAALFEHLRVLYKHDKLKASQLFQRYLGGNYIPQKSNLLYKIILKLTGFKRAEAIRSFLSIHRCLFLS
jgi:glycosyltransferase involved in cell wall biosynthesis